MKGIEQGADVKISTYSNITRPYLVKIGNHVAIDFCFYCTTALSVGDYVHISSHVSVIGGASASLAIEDFVFISTGSRIICGSDKMLGDGLINPFIPESYRDALDNRPITIKRFAGVAANSVVLPGVVMAEGSVLGANSLLKKSTDPWTIYGGSPAKPIKDRKKETMYRYAEELGYTYG